MNYIKMADWETTVHFAHKIVFKLTNDFKTFHYTEVDGSIKRIELDHSVKDYISIIEKHAAILSMHYPPMIQSKLIDSFIHTIIYFGKDKYEYL